MESVASLEAAPPLWRSYLELCKLRIGGMITLTAVVGYAAVAETVNPDPARPAGPGDP